MFSLRRFLALLTAVSPALWGMAVHADTPGAAPGPEAVRTINALFIGNSFTAYNRLPNIVQQLAEAGDPGSRFKWRMVTYGEQNLKQHWGYKSQNWVRIGELTVEEQKKTLDEFNKKAEATRIGREETKSKEQLKLDRRVRRVTTRHQALLELLGDDPPKWDIVVLQSWQDEKGGLVSKFATYARKFAELARRQGSRVILYGTTPRTQNARALKRPPDPAPAIENARFLAALGKEAGADVVPMAYVANRCQTDRPDVTLRYIDDAHPNQTMTYLTACSIYSVLFGKSPEGLPVNIVIRKKVKKPEQSDRNSDSGTQKVVFSDEMLLFLQKTAWDAVQGYHAIVNAKPETGEAISK